MQHSAAMQSGMTIQMVDVKAQYRALKQSIDEEVSQVLDSGCYVLGPKLRAFENDVAAFLGGAHAVGCASGTDALVLALHAGGVGPGDEVVTTPFTFVATAEAVLRVGAVPVFADVDPRTFNIDPFSVAQCMTSRTAAVLPAHLFGHPAPVAALRAQCDAHGALLVEDCAQAFGAWEGGARCGTQGQFGCFSFFPSKNLGGCGDGGLVCTDSAEVAERLRVLRNHGGKGGSYACVGYNSRLDELQAAILRVKLNHVDRFNAERRRIAARYDDLLKGLDLETPREAAPDVHVYHQYTVLCDARDRLARALAQAGIASAVHYRVPLHRQAIFAPFCRGVHLPVAESIARRCLSLPIYPEMPDEYVERIAAVIAETLS